MDRVDLLGIAQAVVIRVDLQRAAGIPVDLVAVRQRVAIGVRIERIGAVRVHLRAVGQAVLVRVRDQRIRFVRVDLGAIAEAVPVRVRHGGLRLVRVDFGAVRQSVAVGVRLERIRFRTVDFLSVVEPVAVGVWNARIGGIGTDFLAIHEPVAVRVRVARVGAQFALFAVRQSVAVTVGIAGFDPGESEVERPELVVRSGDDAVHFVAEHVVEAAVHFEGDVRGHQELQSETDRKHTLPHIGALMTMDIVPQFVMADMHRACAGIQVDVRGPEIEGTEKDADIDGVHAAFEIAAVDASAAEAEFRGEMRNHSLAQVAAGDVVDAPVVGLGVAQRRAVAEAGAEALMDVLRLARKRQQQQAESGECQKPFVHGMFLLWIFIHGLRVRTALPARRPC